MTAKPSDLVIVLACGSLSGNHPCADEIRHRLVQFGFDVTTQQVAAWLRRIGREDSPLIEVGEDLSFGGLVYSVTRFGWTYLFNVLPGIRFYEAKP